MVRNTSKRSRKKAMYAVKRYNKANYGTEGVFRRLKDKASLRKMVIEENLDEEYIENKDLL